MDEREEYGKQHEAEVLKIFDKMVSEFGTSGKTDIPRAPEAPKAKSEAARPDVPKPVKQETVKAASARPVIPQPAAPEAPKAAAVSQEEAEAPLSGSGAHFFEASFADKAASAPAPEVPSAPVQAAPRETVVVKLSDEKKASKEARAAELAYFEALKHEQTEVAYVDSDPVKATSEEDEDEEEEAPRRGLFGLRRSRDDEEDDYDDDDDDDDYDDDDDDGDDDYEPYRPRRHIFLKMLIAVFLLGIVACCAVGIKVGKYVYDQVKDLPEIDPNNIYELLSENSVMYDSEGNFMENVYSGSEIRSNITYSELPDDLINAFVCTEDKTFFEHSGFNFVRIVGAVFYKVTGKSDRISGTSTITQQLARNLYLFDVREERSMQRKLAEAWYTLQIEKTLSKEQILEAYMNTIALGFNCNGVSAASEAYFSKDVRDLTAVEAACLASLPKSPSTLAPIKRIATANVEDPDSLDIITQDADWTIYYNDKIEDRIELVLFNMHDQGKLSDAEYEKACKDKIRDHLNPGLTADSTYEGSTYFADYVVDFVVEDLMKQYGYTRDEARSKVYNGGLQIHSTLNPTIQGIMEEEYANVNNFPSVANLNRDKAGNILGDEGQIILYSKSVLFDGDDNFIIQADEHEWKPDGDLVLFKNNKLNFYKTSVGGNIDYSVEFKNMYQFDDVEKNDSGATRNVLFSRSGVINIPAKYKEKDDEGNLIILADYFKDKPEAFTKNADGTVSVSPDNYDLTQPIMQPQSAMVIVDYSTGYIAGMIGGRGGIEGKLLYNRATNPRQPGSSIKPLAVYSVALQSGVDGEGNYTAATPIDDSPTISGGKPWPKNWYSGYRGVQSLRKAVEQSINCCAVNLFNQLDMEKSISFLQNMGITSLVLEGNVTDRNPAALALGGMCKGVSPLEMAGAYGTFGNFGLHTEPSPYSVVTNKRGDVILTRETPVTTRVMDEAVASLMTDILRTTVTQGLATAAKLNSQPSAGKTGTTSDRYDIWFCGITPKYSAATWIGTDVHICLDSSSTAVTKLWKAVMERVGELDERGTFEMRGEFVTASVDRFSGMLPTALSSRDPRGGVGSEIFIKGTEPSQADTWHMVVPVCRETGYLATPSCTDVVNKVCCQRPGGRSWEAYLNAHGGGLGIRSIPDAVYDIPEYYCPVHNPDAGTYIISPRYSDGIDAYQGMLYDEIEKEYLKDENGNIIDEFGNIAILDAEGKPLLDENGRMIVSDLAGNLCVAGEDGTLIQINGQPAVTDPGLAEISTLPPLPVGWHYVIDPATGLVKRDGFTGEPLSEPDSNSADPSGEVNDPEHETEQQPVQEPGGFNINDLPPLPTGWHYVIDPATGLVKRDSFTGEPVSEPDPVSEEPTSSGTPAAEPEPAGTGASEDPGAAGTEASGTEQ